jgi:hypothetical protein
MRLVDAGPCIIQRVFLSPLPVLTSVILSHTKGTKGYTARKALDNILGFLPYLFTSD